jgi:hypothetical protein
MGGKGEEESQDCPPDSSRYVDSSFLSSAALPSQRASLRTVESGVMQMSERLEYAEWLAQRGGTKVVAEGVGCGVTRSAALGFPYSLEVGDVGGR